MCEFPSERNRRIEETAASAWHGRNIVVTTCYCEVEHILPIGRNTTEETYCTFASGVFWAFFTACYAAAIRETKIATAAALLYTAPAIVLLLSALLFSEKLTPRKIACVLLSVLGCALVSGLGSGGARLTFRGLLLGLGAGLGYALYSIFSRLIQQRGYSTYTNVCYTFSTAAAAYLAIALGNGSAAEIVRLPGAALLSVLCGLLTGLLAYLLYTAGLRELEPSRAAQLATIEPVVAALLGALLFRQSLSAAEVIGIALVVAAVVGMNLRPRREERR